MSPRSKFCRSKCLRHAASRVAAVAVLVAVTGCATTPQPLVLQGEGLGAKWSVKLAGAAPRRCRARFERGIQAQRGRCRSFLSRWDSAPSLSVDQRRAVRGLADPCPPELFAAMTLCVLAGARIRAGRSTRPWPRSLMRGGSARPGGVYSPPSPEALNAAARASGMRKVGLDAARPSSSQARGMQIDLSSMQHGARRRRGWPTT